MKTFVLMLAVLAASPAAAQGLFEEALAAADSTGASGGRSYELNGFVRGVFYEGRIPGGTSFETKSSYGEAALTFRIRRGERGDAYSEIRFRRGFEFGEYLSRSDVREAYADLYLGPFDLRLGHQIVAWGRADGFNPTDNITTKDMLTRSPDEDDRRQANFLVRSFWNRQPFRVELIWVPVFSASVIPTQLVVFPPGISMGDPDYPRESLRNSAVALKVNLELASADGSVSFFDGYDPFPGIDAVTPYAGQLIIKRRAYRTRIVGADFSTALGSLLGLRGEFAYRRPRGDYAALLYVPNPDLQYVIGADKEWGDLSLILQYIGRYVFDFHPLEVPSVPAQQPTYEIERKNRLFNSQQDELSHGVSSRLAWKLLHEALQLELLGYYRFTTDEFLVKPRITYSIADDLTLTAGLETYRGDDDTLFGTIDEHLNSLFFELKTSF